MKNQIISYKNVRTCREPIVGNDSIAFYEGSCDPFVLVGNRLDLIFRMLDSIYKILKCNELLSICLSHNTEFSPTYSYRIRETFDSVRHVDCLSQSPVQVARQHEMAICNLFIWRRRSFSVCYRATKSKQKRLCFLRSLEKEMNNFGLVILSHFLAFVRLSLLIETNCKLNLVLYPVKKSSHFFAGLDYRG